MESRSTMTKNQGNGPSTRGRVCLTGGNKYTGDTMLQRVSTVQRNIIGQVSALLLCTLLSSKKKRKGKVYSFAVRGEIENREGDKRNNRLTPVLLRGICEVSLDNARTRIVDEAPTTEQPNDLTGV